MVRCLNRNTRADIAEDLLADVRKLERLIAEANEISRQKESIKTRENLQFLQTDEISDLKSRAEWYMGTNSLNQEKILIMK